jgi:DNA polymerase III alpha subunit (gram-positive type)
MFAWADVAVAHNAPFDTAMINNEAKRIGVQPVWPKETVCTVQEHMHLKGRRLKLTELYEHATGKVLQQTHRASDDAAALLEALIAMKFFEAF